MIEADRADHSRAKLDHDLIVPITRLDFSISCFLIFIPSIRLVNITPMFCEQQYTVQHITGEHVHHRIRR